MKFFTAVYSKTIKEGRPIDRDILLAVFFAKGDRNEFWPELSIFRFLAYSIPVFFSFNSLSQLFFTHSMSFCLSHFHLVSLLIIHSTLINNRTSLLLLII